MLLHRFALSFCLLHLLKTLLAVLHKIGETSSDQSINTTLYIMQCSLWASRALLKCLPICVDNYNSRCKFTTLHCVFFGLRKTTGRTNNINHVSIPAMVSQKICCEKCRLLILLLIFNLWFVFVKSV